MSAGPVGRPELSRRTQRPRHKVAGKPVAGRAGNGISALVLFVVVAGAPLLFGSTDPPVLAFWCIVLGVGLTFASLRDLHVGQLALLGAVLLFVALYALVIHEQASDMLGGAIDPSLSIARNQPLFALGAPLLCVLALVSSFIVGSNAALARRLLWVVAWSGAAYAVFGIVSQLIDPTMLLWREKPGSNLTATFVNRNTAGPYLGSCAVVWLLLILRSLRQIAGRGRHWLPRL